MEKEIQNEIGGPQKKMKEKDLKMPNFTLIPDSQSLIVDLTSIKQAKYAKTLMMMIMMVHKMNTIHQNRM